ncbi:MAG: divalent-cation tolerance protein CutA [Thaumarchaeota archaeon]|nr:divalent-cation tolerance protein CutA [Nitrososphaerota archaeon]
MGSAQSRTARHRPVLIVSTYPDKASLGKVANQLVSSGIVACVNITRTSSIYMWEGKIEEASEYIGFFKTTQKNKKTLKAKILQTHPYDVPEIAEIDITSVNKPYYDWLVESTSGDTNA